MEALRIDLQVQNAQRNRTTYIEHLLRYILRRKHQLGPWTRVANPRAVELFGRAVEIFGTLRLQNMEYEQEEVHLEHANSPEGLEQVRDDMKKHFVSGGVQIEGDINTVMHSTEPAAAPEGPKRQARSSELAKELDGMVARHQQDEKPFVRGVAGLEVAYAEEEADAE